MFSGQIRHRDRALKGGPESAAGHDSRVRAAPQNRITLPCDVLAVVGHQAGEFLLEAEFVLSAERGFADKGAAQLDENREAGFERRGLAVEFMAIEREAGLESERIASAEANRH